MVKTSGFIRRSKVSSLDKVLKNVRGLAESNSFCPGIPSSPVTLSEVERT